MFLNGNTIRQICRTLTERKIPTPSGKENWAVSTVRSILTNERYKGEALLQKKFTVDFLKKKMVKNEGQVPQYYVENSHPAIVSAEMFDMVQAEMAKQSQSGVRRSNISCLSGKLICPICGSVYSRKTWRSCKGGERIKRQIWQCSDKYKERGKSCPSCHVTEEEVQTAFIKAINSVIGDKERYIAALEPLLDLLADMSAIENEEAVLKERSAGIYAQMSELVSDNAHRAQDQTLFNERYNELNGRYEKVKAELENIEVRRVNRLAKRENIQQFIDTLKNRDKLLTDFDEQLWRATVESVVVHSKTDFEIKFKDGQIIRREN
jgi:hypothetical protein